jgi:hypothetical protein
MPLLKRQTNLVLNFLGFILITNVVVKRKLCNEPRTKRRFNFKQKLKMNYLSHISCFQTVEELYALADEIIGVLKTLEADAPMRATSEDTIFSVAPSSAVTDDASAREPKSDAASIASGQD